MFKQSNNFFLIFIFFIVLATLITAFFIQYGLGYQPCKLCVYERIPYLISIFGAALSFYHFGIEQGFFNELSTCKADSSLDLLSKEQLLNELNKTIVSCKDIDFRIIGLSLASINTIFSLVLSAIFLRLFINYGKI